MKTDYEYIVLGCGGIGSGALYWLARRAGAEVLGIEQFQLFHHNGGSQDRSRVIRHYYHKDHYARLTPFIYDAWATVSEEAAIPIVTKTGGVLLATKGSPQQRTIEIYAESLDDINVDYEWLGMDELAYRYPQFRSERELAICYQKDTGLVDPMRGNASHVALARGYGAQLLEECPVRLISSAPDGVTVETENGTFRCRKLIVASGAWTNQTLASLDISIPLRVSQEQVTYFATPHLKEFSIGNFPVFQWKTDLNIYGFPVYGEVATKAAIDDSGGEVTAETRTFAPDAAREAQLRAFLEAGIPNFVGPKLYTKTCLYTMPPDREFVLGALPEHPDVLVAVGAGHAYKFASFLGQMLSDLAIDGETVHDISHFVLDRPALTDPAWAREGWHY